MQQIYYDFIKHFMCFSEFSEQFFYLFEFSSIFLNFLIFPLANNPLPPNRRGDQQPAGEGAPPGVGATGISPRGEPCPGTSPLGCQTSP